MLRLAIGVFLNGMQALIHLHKKLRQLLLPQSILLVITLLPMQQWVQWVITSLMHTIMKILSSISDMITLGNKWVTLVGKLVSQQLLEHRQIQ